MSRDLKANQTTVTELPFTPVGLEEGERTEKIFTEDAIWSIASRPDLFNTNLQYYDLLDQDDPRQASRGQVIHPNVLTYRKSACLWRLLSHVRLADCWIHSGRIQVFLHESVLGF